MIIKPSHNGLELARGIRAAGRPIYIKEDDGEPTDDLSDGLRIYLFGEVNDSLVTNFLGGTAFILKTNITVNLPGFAISGFGLELEWTVLLTFLLILAKASARTSTASAEEIFPNIKGGRSSTIVQMCVTPIRVGSLYEVTFSVWETNPFRTTFSTA